MGTEHKLELNSFDFRVVLSVEAHLPEHINLAEARAVVLYVKWILRSQRRFNRRLLVLVDSRVVLGAVTKGRSSSVPLNRILRQLAALSFAGGLTMQVVFTPTRHNPADAPSRGIRPKKQATG